MVLSDRGNVVDDKTRARILACRDLDLLDRWIRQVNSGKSLKDLENL